MRKVSLSPSCSPSPIQRNKKKKLLVLKRAMAKKSWSTRDWESRQNWKAVPITHASSSEERWIEPRKKHVWRDVSRIVDELGNLIKDKKSSWNKSSK